MLVLVSIAYGCKCSINDATGEEREGRSIVSRGVCVFTDNWCALGEAVMDAAAIGDVCVLCSDCAGPLCWGKLCGAVREESNWLSPIEFGICGRC